MRRLLCFTVDVLIFSLAIFATNLSADTYPLKPVRLMTGFPSGGPTDLMARVIGEKLQSAWKQSVIVEAKPGASGALSMEQIKAAAPDGYSLLMAPTNTLAVNPHLFPKLAYDPTKDFSLIARVANIDNVLVVHPSVEATTLLELVNLARTKPRALTFGSPANGSQAHLAGEFLNQQFGIQLVHVPYKGIGPAQNDLISGQIAMLFSPVANALAHIRSGRLRAVGIPARERNASIPNTQTFAEQGVTGFEAVTWFMLIGPAGMPTDLVERIRVDVSAALKNPDLKERFRAFGAETPSANEDLQAFLRTELSRWGQVVTRANIKPD